MADEYILKSYDGGAETTTLTSPFTLSGTTLVVANGSTFPDGSGGPFVVVIDRGLATEEKFLIDTTSGTNGTTFNIQQAGYDGTSASSHSNGATVEHCLDAYSIEQANRYVNLQTARGDIVAHNNTTTTKLGVGANNTVLMADSAQTAGLKYSTVGSASITDGAVVEAKIGAGAVTEAKIGTGAITNTKLGEGSVTADKLDSQALAAAVPVGSVTAFAGSAAPSGWLICDGATPSRSTYSALFAVIGTTYGVGNGSTTFTLPNLKGRAIVGRDPSDGDTTALNFSSLGAARGAKTHTLSTSEMPSHAHGPGTSVDNDGNTDGRSSNRIINAQTQSPGDGWATTGTATLGARASTATAPVGGSGAHNNLQPSLVLNYIIKT